MEANQAEIELGRLAESKAENPQVKDFAAMMVRDHTDALNRLREVPGAPTSNSTSSSATTTTSGQGSRTKSQSSSTSSSGEIQLSKEHQQLLDRLQNLSGSNFDREYVNAMVQEHQKDVRAFQDKAGVSGTSSSSGTTSNSGQGRAKPSTEPTEPGGAASGSDSAQSVARELLPTLQMHLSEAQSLQRQLQQGQR
jgi:predicted outer membrane protein